jgi:hypothetical protein
VVSTDVLSRVLSELYDSWLAARHTKSCHGLAVPSDPITPPSAIIADVGLPIREMASDDLINDVHCLGLWRFNWVLMALKPGTTRGHCLKLGKGHWHALSLAVWLNLMSRRNAIGMFGSLIPVWWKAKWCPLLRFRRRLVLSLVSSGPSRV